MSCPRYYEYRTTKEIWKQALGTFLYGFIMAFVVIFKVLITILMIGLRRDEVVVKGNGKEWKWGAWSGYSSSSSFS